MYYNAGRGSCVVGCSDALICEFFLLLSELTIPSASELMAIRFVLSVVFAVRLDSGSIYFGSMERTGTRLTLHSVVDHQACLLADQTILYALTSQRLARSKKRPIQRQMAQAVCSLKGKRKRSRL
jgi:hypothetical protein